MSTTGQPLGQLCLQVHLGRAPGLAVDRLQPECEAIARRTTGIRGIGFTEGEDDGGYLNIVFASEDPEAVWPALHAALAASPAFGGMLDSACICLCTGDDGWNDCRVLHHFDPAMQDDAAGEDGDVDDDRT